MNKFFKKATLLDFVKSRYGGAAIGAAFSGISTYSLMRLLKASKESRIAATIGATIIGAGVGREIGKRYEKPIKIELKKLKQQDIAGVRQVSNTAQPYTTNKIGPGEKLKTAVENLKDVFNKNKNARALVYSNYLEAGIDPYGELLDRAGIKYNKFNGSMSAKQKKEVVDSYNRGEVPVILGSGSASEGLDLKGTRLIQILEPHFNNAKIDQVIGRGIRYKSHSDLPVRDREVLVQKYISTLPDDSSWFTRSKPQVSVDQYLTARAKEKQELIDDARTLLEN